MCGNTRPEFSEVSYRMISQHNKGLLSMNTSVNSCSARYGVTHKLRTRTPLWFPDARCRTSDRHWRPLDQPPGTTTETDEDGGRRRRKQTKTETVEDEDRLSLGTSELAVFHTADDNPRVNTELNMAQNTQEIKRTLFNKTEQDKTCLPALWKKTQNTQEIKRALFYKTEQDKTCGGGGGTVSTHPLNPGVHEGGEEVTITRKTGPGTPHPTPISCLRERERVRDRER